MQNFDRIWEQVKDGIAQRISEASFATWIRDLEAMGFREGAAVLYTSSSYQRDIIKNRFMNAIIESFEEVLGRECEVRIITKDELDSGAAPDGPTSPIEQVAKSAVEPDNTFTFENFIVGNSNKFAHAASLAVANNPGYAYNPLFIYGDSGLGKTHLLKAIKNEIENSNPDLKVAFVTCEDFTNEFLELLRAGRGAEFRNRYRPVDVLLIDDIQFIAGKQSTEEEFLNTFNTLYDKHKQIVMAADRKPNEMKTLADRLRTRFEQGLLADIQQPDYETRVAIVKSKAGLLGLEIPDEVAEFIASRLKSHTRQLESAVKKLSAYHKLSGDPLSLSMAQNAIKDTIVEDAEAGVDEEKILEEISRTLSVPVDEICGRKQTADVSFARQVAAYVLHETTNYSTKKIGDVLGGKDHSTIVYYLRKVEKDKKTNTKLRNTVDDIIKNIKGK
ncbi:MAG: chromosomal replication initiator protein DnaA [Clostridia bacterium]|nr:chromosomal replication initiator protein DnaA [Clostridia bacterium]